jgi:5-bromo-4-chloroindolyl phosphate hydrolysis protein
MLKFIFSLIAGILTFSAIRFFLAGWIATPILAGIAVFIVSLRLLKKIFNKSASEKKSDERLNKYSKDKNNNTQYSAKYLELVDLGRSKVVNMRNSTRMIKDNDIARNIQDICKTGTKIFDELKEHPEDIKKAKPFINYYLDSTDKIIKQYIEFSSKQMTPEIQKSLDKVEELLAPIKETFEKQLSSLMEDDLLDLDVELSVLEKTMRLEG